MRNLTDEDIAAIITALARNNMTHPCRFEEVEVADLKEAVKFYKHFNAIIEDSGTTIRKTILVLGITIVASILGLGLIAKIKGAMGL